LNQKQLHEQLKYLEQYGVADINLQTSGSRITFLTGRIPSDQLTISPSIYGQRKEFELKRLQKVKDYLAIESCRTVQIANYFDQEQEPCGNCDVCSSNESENHTHGELLELIPTLLPASVGQLVERTKVSKTLIERAIRKLILEESIIEQAGIYANA